MKVSRAWLQRYFKEPLPSIEVLADALTFHAFEIESIEGDVLDVKVLPDRAPYALSHRGIAKEVSAILDVPLVADPLRQEISPLTPAPDLTVTIDTQYVIRHVAALIEGVTVKESPLWLRELLESVGQRSINNIVDATNFVMLDIGQPMHAFDAAYVRGSNGQIHIDIRPAAKAEKVTTLSGDECTLDESMYVISNGSTGEALDIAGVKGGKLSGVTDATTSILLSVGTYDGERVRKTCQKLSIHTDASQRYQNRPSPELGGYGMRDILSLIVSVAGGTVVGGIDMYPSPDKKVRTVSLSAQRVSHLLGASYTAEDIARVFSRLDLSFTQLGDEFTVSPPFERTDISIPEDLIEEVGRLIGYDHVEPRLLPNSETAPIPQFVQGAELLRDMLVREGCIEISSYSLVASGDIELQKPLADDKKFLRPNLFQGHAKALAMNAAHMPLYNLSELKLFEMGRVWPQGVEIAVLGVSYWSPSKDNVTKRTAFFADIESKISALCGVEVRGKIDGGTWQCEITEALFTKLPEAYVLPLTKLGLFQPFSVYPCALRDVAVWTPAGTDSEFVHQIIRGAAGSLLVRSDLHDVFTKDGRTSLMFKLVFQAFDHTLTDVELVTAMQRVTDILNAEVGFSVR